MVEKAMLSLGESSPDANELFCFLTTIFGVKWPGGWEEKIKEFLDLVYTITRQAGITIYQDTKIDPFLKQGQSYIAEYDKMCDKWLIIVAHGEEYTGTINALRFISAQLISEKSS